MLTLSLPCRLARIRQHAFMISKLTTVSSCVVAALAAGCAPVDGDESSESLATYADIDAGAADIIDAGLPALGDAAIDAGDVGDASLLPASKRAEPVLVLGPGCPFGFATASWSDDRMYADVTFSGRYVSDADRVSTTCIITVPTPAVTGRSYTIASIVTNGALSLSQNASARFWTRFWVEGEYTLGTNLREEFRLRGPQTGEFENRGKGVSYNAWTYCDSDDDLLLEQRLNVLGASSSEAERSFARIDRIRVRLAERACTPD